VENRADELAGEGKTPMFFSRGNQFLGLIAVADTVKDDSAAAVAELVNMGMRVIMLTGDNKRTANAIGKLAGINEVIPEVMPDGKAAEITRLREMGGRVIMVGDGINDAPALATADTGIAIGAGTDVAIDAADVVLMKSRLSELVAAIKLSRATLRNIHQNLFWAFCYHVIGIPLAVGIWIPLLGWELDPMFGAATMSLSSFCVVTNALRLNLTDLYRPARKRIKKETSHTDKARRKGVKAMIKTMNIGGMMGPLCLDRVQKALETLDCVESAVASHESGTATVTLKNATDDAILKKTVEEQGYTVVGIK
jgi:Cu2+-exporting ATPase